MSFLGTVIPDDGLRVRRGPGTEHEVLGALSKDEQIVLLARAGDWWSVDSRFGPGFVHADFLAVVETAEPGGAAATASEQNYTCVAGDTLIRIGARFGLDHLEIAALNGLVPPFSIQIGQVLRIPRAGIRPVTATLSILNPLAFQGETEVTSSSLQGHHTPFLGACSCDLDIRGASSAGTPVHFNLAGPAGLELRGIVREVGLACSSQRVSDGGRTVKLMVQRREAGGDWTDSGAWVLYAHLDPVTVSPSDVVAAGEKIGALGPAGGGEYNSSCAQGSHVHVEALRARCVVNQGAVIANAPLMVLDA